MPESTASTQTIRYRLFDSDGLPWTSTLSGAWLYWITVFSGFIFAFFLGIYLGLWLKSKGKGVSGLLMYLAVAGSAIFLFFLSDRAYYTENTVLTSTLILWFTAAYVCRYKVIRYYSHREGTPFRINPVLAGLFSVWYINSCLRADFPLDEKGKTSTGVLKLMV